VPDKPTPLRIAHSTGKYIGVHRTRADKRWTSLLSAAKGAEIAHRGRSLISTIALLLYEG